MASCCCSIACRITEIICGVAFYTSVIGAISLYFTAIDTILESAEVFDTIMACTSRDIFAAIVTIRTARRIVTIFNRFITLIKNAVRRYHFTAHCTSFSCFTTVAVFRNFIRSLASKVVNVGGTIFRFCSCGAICICE